MAKRRNTQLIIRFDGCELDEKKQARIYRGMRRALKGMHVAVGDGYVRISAKTHLYGGMLEQWLKRITTDVMKQLIAVTGLAPDQFRLIVV